MNGKQEYGDYQTPTVLADRVCEYLRHTKGLSPSVVIVPTCGIGNFLQSSLSFGAEKYYGVEINGGYCAHCQERFIDLPITIFHCDFFDFNFQDLVTDPSNILIIGNPPWVTNSMLSAGNSPNLPPKTNFKALRGIDALTGTSNFDLCEFMILRLIWDFRNTNTTIAMLCKTTVARNVFQELQRCQIGFEYFELLLFDAQKEFGVCVSACVLLVKLSKTYYGMNKCQVISLDNAKEKLPSLSYDNGQILAENQTFLYDFGGPSCFEWRQGIKHDCAKIMELSKKDGLLLNGKGEIVELEDDFIFPLVKTSMFKKPVIYTFSKYVLVTQKKAREKTDFIARCAPKTWAYLTQNAASFANRKSVIYQNAPPFSMFGIGDYSYSPYKVGVSGFYKKPFFSVLCPEAGKPVMTDDTSYFICFQTYDMAYVSMLILNSNLVQQYLMNIAFLDAKRPYTKKVLSRLSFQKILSVLQYEDLKETERTLSLEEHLTREMFFRFKGLSAPHQLNQLLLQQA